MHHHHSSSKAKSLADFGGGGIQESNRAERPWLHRLWDRWAAASVAPSGTALSGAALLNYLPDRPSRMFSSLIAQEGLSLRPPELRSLVDGVRAKSLQNDYFLLGNGKYLVTSIYEHFYCARRVDASTSNGEGAIIACIPAFILISTYEGSFGAAVKAMAATTHLTDALSQRTG